MFIRHYRDQRSASTKRFGRYISNASRNGHTFQISEMIIDRKIVNFRSSFCKDNFYDFGTVRFLERLEQPFRNTGIRRQRQNDTRTAESCPAENIMLRTNIPLSGRCIIYLLQCFAMIECGISKGCHITVNLQLLQTIAVTEGRISNRSNSFVKNDFFKSLAILECNIGNSSHVA